MFMDCRVARYVLRTTLAPRNDGVMEDGVPRRFAAHNNDRAS